MPFESISELVERITRESKQTAEATANRIQQTQEGMFRKGSRRSDYEEGLRECWATILRLSKKAQLDEH